MKGAWKTLLNTTRMLARFAGLTVLVFLSLAACILTNASAFFFMHGWLLAPGFRFLDPRCPLLASASRLFSFGG